MEGLRKGTAAGAQPEGRQCGSCSAATPGRGASPEGQEAPKSAASPPSSLSERPADPGQREGGLGRGNPTAKTLLSFHSPSP